MKGWGGSCRGGVGHEEIWWVMKGWGWAVQNFMNCMKQPQSCISTKGADYTSCIS